MSGFSFSFNCGRRLCKVIGGKDDGKFIYLYDKKYTCCPDCNDDCDGTCCKDCAKKNYHRKNKMIMGTDYCKITDDGIFQQVPTNISNQSDVNMYAGKRGCGKSFSLAGFARQYRLLFPKRKIYLFSQCKEDPVLDGIIDKRIDLEKYVEKGGLTIDSFKEPCFVIFDDIDMLSNVKGENLRDKIFHLMNSLIQLSRKKGITVAQTTHVATNHGETKHILNGCSSFTFYLHAVSNQIKNALKIYFGLSPEEIKKVLALKNTRQVTIFTTSPTIVMSDKEMFLLNSEHKRVEEPIKPVREERKYITTKDTTNWDDVQRKYEEENIRNNYDSEEDYETDNESYESDDDDDRVWSLEDDMKLSDEAYFVRYGFTKDGKEYYRPKKESKKVSFKEKPLKSILKKKRYDSDDEY